MNNEDVLALLVAQAEREGSDLLTLRAVIEEASQLGARRMLARLSGAIGDWLGGHFGEPELRLAFDADRIEGLSAEREARWARVSAADFLSEDEKRAAVGYGPR